MGRWVIVGFVILAGVVFVLTRPAEQADVAPVGESAQHTDASEAAAGEAEPSRADDTAARGDDGRLDELAKLDDADASEAGAAAGDPEPSPWTLGRDGFEPPRIDPAALELLANPPPPTPPDNWEEISTHRYVYPDHIEALIDGTGKSLHEEAVDDFMRENPPGPSGYRWSEVDAAFEEGRRRQAEPE